MPDKNITDDITYNFLNLPEQVIQDGNPTTYTYRADGTKIHKLFTINGQDIDTDYIDGFVYTTPYTEGLDIVLRDNPQAALAGQAEAFELGEIVGTDPRPQIPETTPNFFPTAEGFYDYDNFRYIYQYKDQVGNVRLSYVKDPDTGEAVGESSNDYYPFGLNFINIHTRQIGHTVYNPSVSFENWKMQGQELQETGFYQYKWRQYMPDVGRFFNIDPLSEKYAYNSTYAFQENKMGLGRELEGLELLQERGMITATGMAPEDFNTTEPIPDYVAYYYPIMEAPETQGMDVPELPSGARGMGKWDDSDGSFESFVDSATATKLLAGFELIKLINTGMDGLKGIKITTENVKAVEYIDKLRGQFKDMTTAKNLVNKADLKLNNKTKTEISNYVFDGSLPKDVNKRNNSIVNLDSKSNIINTANSIMRKNNIIVHDSPEVKRRTQLDDQSRMQKHKDVE